MVSVGTFNYWITDMSFFKTINPKSGNTGTFDLWITSSVYFSEYVSAPVSGESVKVRGGRRVGIGGGYGARR